MNDAFINTVFEQKQFEHKQLMEWVEAMFQIKKKLQSKYDKNDQDLLYIKIYEFITNGKAHLLMVKETHEKQNSQFPNSFKALLDLALEILENLDQSELEFIEFRRNAASHIFTKGYNIIQDNLTIKDHRKDKKMIVIHSSFNSIFQKHSTRKGFDIYFNKKIFNCLDKYYLV